MTFEGRHYTGYEATQVQRQLETEMRKAKDTQILAKASGDDVMRREAQKRINLLQSKYKQFSDAAGLPYKANRASVSGYHRVSELTTQKINDIIIKNKQFGKKIGKHAKDWGLDASNPDSRKLLENIICDIVSNHNLPIRIGEWRGQREEVLFYIKGEDVVITKQNGEFVTILKGGISNARVANAREQKLS